MVSLVLVSHSQALAGALVQLVKQVALEKTPPIAFAAGAGSDHQEFGTDATEIVAAIQSVYSPDGVLVLMDLGSAVLSAEMALDFLPEEMRPQVRLCSAPFVEGAITAGVQASLGSDLDSVCREAEQALQQKSSQLSPASPLGAHPEQAKEVSLEPERERVLTLKNEAGLHARPAARFAQKAASYDADVRVRNLTNGKGPVSARSLLSVIALGAVKGSQIGISASGREAASALQALSELIEEGLE
jgi:multiphosphoryl transfer protein